MCMCSVVIDVQMIAKLAHGIFACVARGVKIENEQNQLPFFVSSAWIARASTIVKTSDLKQVYSRYCSGL